jgi:hypothetical protein
MISKDREGKLKLLTDLLERKITISDLLPSNYLIKVIPGNTKFYKNGKEIIKEEYSNHVRGSKKPIKFIVTVSDLNENKKGKNPVS